MAEKKKVKSVAPATTVQAQETIAPVTKEDKVQEARTTSQPGYQMLRQDIPTLKPGDEIKVFYRVIEAGKERIQGYEGTVIALKSGGVSSTVTVRKTSFGIAVERIFPLHSALIQKIEVKKHTKVRRAKLYYLRKLTGKASRLKELR